MLQGRADAIAFACAVQTVFLLFLFALIVAALHTDAEFLSARSKNSEAASPAMVQGIRAAAGAALDASTLSISDFKAQAVMAALMLCGGLCWGSADSADRAPGGASFLSKISGWLTLALALLLVPTAFWIPLQSGTPRSEAEELRAYLDLITAHPEKTQPGT